MPGQAHRLANCGTIGLVADLGQETRQWEKSTRVGRPRHTRDRPSGAGRDVDQISGLSGSGTSPEIEPVTQRCKQREFEARIGLRPIGSRERLEQLDQDIEYLTIWFTLRQRRFDKRRSGAERRQRPRAVEQRGGIGRRGLGVDGSEVISQAGAPSGPDQIPDLIRRTRALCRAAADQPGVQTVLTGQQRDDQRSCCCRLRLKVGS